MNKVIKKKELKNEDYVETKRAIKVPFVKRVILRGSKVEPLGMRKDGGETYVKVRIAYVAPHGKTDLLVANKNDVFFIKLAMLK